MLSFDTCPRRREEERGEWQRWARAGAAGAQLGARGRPAGTAVRWRRRTGAVQLAVAEPQAWRKPPCQEGPGVGTITGERYMFRGAERPREDTRRVVGGDQRKCGWTGEAAGCCGGEGSRTLPKVLGDFTARSSRAGWEMEPNFNQESMGAATLVTGGPRLLGGLAVPFLTIQ